jgi:hypothetical protein
MNKIVNQRVGRQQWKSSRGTNCHVRWSELAFSQEVNGVTHRLDFL